MSFETEQDRVIGRQEASLISRREAIQRVTAMLGGIALVGGSGLLTACRDDRARGTAGAEGAGQFTQEDIAFLDEVADTILPETSTPGAKAAQTGAFMALMVTAGYEPGDQQVFRDGIRQLDEASQRMHNVGFMQATPQQRLALLEQLDREQHQYTRDRDAARRQRAEAARTPPAARTPTTPRTQADTATTDTTDGDAYLSDQRQEGAIGTGDANPASAITADAPSHYFRMMKELALLGYFTSEIGYTQAMRYQETPGRYEPCTPYTPGEPAWAPHA
ncbi:MAG: gluconate 2-dehydrogenase subunit 3 family protein [Longimicrobiaceae bacterium]